MGCEPDGRLLPPPSLSSSHSFCPPLFLFYSFFPSIFLFFSFYPSLLHFIPCETPFNSFFYLSVIQISNLLSFSLFPLTTHSQSIFPPIYPSPFIVLPPTLLHPSLFLPLSSIHLSSFIPLHFYSLSNSAIFHIHPASFSFTPDHLSM